MPPESANAGLSLPEFHLRWWSRFGRKLERGGGNRDDPDLEQDMAKPPVYSPFLECLYDQDEAVGALGYGTHYSIFRSIEWRDLNGDFLDSGRSHDFAIIWDSDHDTRVVRFAEHLHTHGILWPIVFLGEVKGVLTILLWQDVDPVRERSDWFDVVKEIAECGVECDVWTVEFGKFFRDPANSYNLTEPLGIINDDEELVVAYLQAIDALWRLGTKKRAEHKPMEASYSKSAHRFD
jgi:hypothetical protein